MPRHSLSSQNIKERSCTYRSPYREIENLLRNQCSRWISVARGAPRYLAKVRRFASRKAIQNQPLTSSVLNPRSRELWRKTVREIEFRVTVGATQYGGLRANARVYWVFLRGLKWAENVAPGYTGGGSGIRNPGTVPTGPVLPRCGLASNGIGLDVTVCRAPSRLRLETEAARERPQDRQRVAETVCPLCDCRLSKCERGASSGDARACRRSRAKF
jgi:hypothetical protein